MDVLKHIPRYDIFILRYSKLYGLLYIKSTRLSKFMSILLDTKCNINIKQTDNLNIELDFQIIV